MRKDSPGSDGITPRDQQGVSGFKFGVELADGVGTGWGEMILLVDDGWKKHTQGFIAKTFTAEALLTTMDDVLDMQKN